MRKHVLLYGLVGGALVAVLKFIEYRWLLVEYSIEFYAALRIKPRELEILAPIAGGLSNKEIATKLFVNENTVKTHSSRADPSVIGNAQAQCCHWTFSIADCEWNKICRNTKFPRK